MSTKAIFFSFLLAFSSQVHAAVYTVTTTNDTGAGTLREAITQANLTPEADVIAFNLPGTGVQTIAPATSLPAITGPVTIDGFTQPGSRANTLTNGNNAVLLVRLDGVNVESISAGLEFTGAKQTVRGLVIVRFWEGVLLAGCTDCVVAGNWIGLDVDSMASGNDGAGVSVVERQFQMSTRNQIGGLNPQDRNVISGNGSGIMMFPNTSSYNVVLGNYIGTDATGTLPRGNLFDGIQIHAGANNVIGGRQPGARNVIGANGNGIFLLAAPGTVIQGNSIGADATGTHDLGNTEDGIGIQGGQHFTIGGGDLSAANVMVNNRRYGMSLLGCDDAQIAGNFIGTDATALLALGNALGGIYIQGANSNSIGGDLENAANTIRFNAGPGVYVLGGEGNSIRRNRIFGNRGLGIDLYPDGVTPNDEGDADTGPNRLQNCPILDKAVITPGAVLVQGRLSSRPGASFRIDLYADDSKSPAAPGQAELLLGGTTLVTAADGQGAFDVLLPVAIPNGYAVTATATDVSGNSSEFSPAFSASFDSSAPTLTISESSGFSVIGWPSSAAGFNLEFNPDLKIVTNWALFSGPILNNGQMKSAIVTNQNAGPSLFFRLKKD